MSNPVPAEVEEKLKAYRSLQADVAKLYANKQQILSQFNENTLVKGELDLLDESNAVFKLVGPVLLPVELGEAKENVSKRLEFIEAEVKKAENNIESKQTELQKLGDEIAALQQRMQADAVIAARKIASEVAP